MLPAQLISQCYVAVIEAVLQEVDLRSWAPHTYGILLLII